ncbi:hypothetical protein [Micromonospora sp. LOL_021]|uniref:hypothetical protein n=1 Tax=Micromonospora sp. LOL_021 TaxID=3345417 RepID=UPI003A867C7C
MKAMKPDARNPNRHLRLTCSRQALTVLVWFRKGEDTALLGTGSDVARATAYRCLAEGITVLTAQATDLHIVLNRAATELNLPTLADSGYEAQARASRPRSSNSPMAAGLPATTASTTICCTVSGGRANAASPS